MTKDEALKLALEALEEAWYHVGTFQPTEKAIDLYDEARTAIKEALAQPEQEPVAVRYDYDGYGYQYIDSGSGSDWQTRVQGEPLYTTPPQIEVGCAECGVNGGHALYCVACAEKFVGLENENRSILIRTLKWCEDLLREAGHDEAVNEVQDCIMQLRKAQEK